MTSFRTLPSVRTRLLAATALGAGVMLAIAIPLSASAHVEFVDNQASAGSAPILQFKVPDESDTLTTTKLVIDLPTAHPLLEVRYVPVPGWTAVVATTKLPKPINDGDDTITEGVTSVTWTADAGAGVPPNATQIFSMAVEPVPNVGKMTFLAHQTYSDGSVVNWVDGSEEDAHPAPVLYVNDAAPVESSSGITTTASASADAAATSGGSNDTDVIARVFGLAGLVLGVIGLIVGVSARMRPAAATADDPDDDPEVRG